MHWKSNNELNAFKAAIVRHKRAMRKRDEKGDDVWNILLIFVFLLFFGGYFSCLATGIVQR